MTSILREINPWLLLALGFAFGLCSTFMIANYYINGLLAELMRTF